MMEGIVGKEVGRCLRPALPMNRALLRSLGLSVGIAIALAGCDEPSPPAAEATEYQYSTVGMIASDYGAAQKLAKSALADGILTNPEYDEVLGVDRAENARACSYAKAMLQAIALDELPKDFRPDMWWACETGMIVAHDYGASSYADIIAGKQPSPYTIAEADAPK